MHIRLKTVCFYLFNTMGLDIKVMLIHGHILCLRECAELLDLSILDGDDWKNFHDTSGADRELLIKQYIKDIPLRCWLLDHLDWNLCFTTTTQEDPDLDNSFVYIFDALEPLFYGRVPVFQTGVVDIAFSCPSDVRPPIYGLGPYHPHWISM